MKIPEEVKKSSEWPGRWKPARTKPGYKKKHGCGYCGQVGTHPEGKNCPAYGKRCSKCQRFNHFSTVCRADNNMETQQHIPEWRQPEDTKQKRNVKRTTEDLPDSSTSSDDEFFLSSSQTLEAS
ncbi:hypothetical protein OS493_028490 [Desmophyllum pertusum]|uniref:Uncharacterized protein n=1 Tax=Desmophyllum pertusum TaxID=174260 RepID=A0A9W9Z9H7_9CNID|nr:hypothetical protein OS493_028490 [Desmophyllum pertusum]